MAKSKMKKKAAVRVRDLTPRKQVKGGVKKSLTADPCCGGEITKRTRP